jgi:uncharacterized protein
MQALTWILLAAVVCYGSLVVALYFGQRALMYFPTARRIAPADAGLPQAAEVILDTSDGEKIIAWHVPLRSKEPIVLFFHGNGDSLAGRAGRFRELIAAGVGLLAVSYRGYSGSTGSPTEEGLHRDAIAAYEFAATRYAPEQLALWGFSLGSGVAVALAADRPTGKLVLEASYTSTLDMAAGMFPMAPVQLLMKDQFRSDQRIRSVHVPILMLHGERDQTIPISVGERLFAMAPGAKRFVRFPHGHHDDLDDYGVVAEVLKFLADTNPG